MNVVHGDLKGDNVLIDDSGRACLCDFGIASVTIVGTMGSTRPSNGTIRWMAPEVFDLEEDDASQNSHKPTTFSLPKLNNYQVFSGKIPFAPFKTEQAVMMRIIRGMRPERPDNSLEIGLTDKIWEIVVDSWQEEPEKRPDAQLISRLLQT